MEIQKSMVVGEAFSSLLGNESALLDAMEKVLDSGFYSRMEICVINQPENRRRLNHIMKDHHACLTYWTIPAMTAEGLCLSSLDKAMRDKTVSRIQELIHSGAECGALYIGIPSGADPGLDKREDATKHLIDSICRLKDTMAEYPEASLLLEPLDREVHKRQLIGPMNEVVALTENVRREGVPFYICWDSAHEALGGADLQASFAQCAPYMAQFHLCNAVLNPASKLYGDYHLPVGHAENPVDEGYLTLEAAARILRQAQQLNGLSGRPLTTALEIRTAVGGDGFETEALIRSFLTKAFALAASGEAR